MCDTAMPHCSDGPTAVVGEWRCNTHTMADTHHCPFCELIFVNLAELQAHITVDHPEREVPERRH